MNTAFVFLKPHAARDSVEAFTRQHLDENNVKIIKEGVLASEEIKAKGIIDTHYAALAANAVRILPADLAVTAAKKEEFAGKYGVGWDDAAKKEELLNLDQFQKKFPSMSVTDIENKWRAGDTLKLAPGTYVSTMKDEGVSVINGFYGSMREKFTAAGVHVRWFVVEFQEEKLKWTDFRAKVIGATDPSAASEGSLRQKIKSSWKDLKLDFEPSTADNGVHASAGPIEGLKERATWLGIAPNDDPVGKQLAAAGVGGALLNKMLNNEVVELPNGEKGPCFDVTEDMNTSDFVKMAKDVK